MKTNKEPLKNEEERKERSRSSYSELPEDEDSSPAKTAKKESRKGIKMNREISILKRSKTVKEKTDPDRFNGDGVNFKAKIIGIEHVFDARGNRMCQGALQRLKAAVKTSGDHKQKIILNISFKGIIIKDEKSGEILHHHPIHKISFISQDTSDTRSFGYVFGCPQSGHRFFAIKTEKTASQVVVTLRELFLAALEIKKKEIEKALESQNDGELENGVGKEESKVMPNGSTDDKSCAVTLENGCDNSKGFNHDLLYSNTVSLPEESVVKKSETNSHEAEATVDTLLDLQFEVDTLQQGISQMDHSIASASTQGFGFSFSEDDVSESSSSSVPMTFQFKLDKLSSLYQETLSISSRSSSTSDYNACAPENKMEDFEVPKNDLFNAQLPFNQCPVAPPPPVSVDNISPTSEVVNGDCASVASNPVEDRYAVFLDIDSLPSIFDNPDIMKTSNIESESSLLNFSKDNSTESSEEMLEVKSSTPVVFAELDPLGNHPFIDKKDFFQDLKKPAKKVLKDLVSGSTEYFENSVDSNIHNTELFHGPLENDTGIQTNKLEFNVDEKPFNPFADQSTSPIPPRTPPKLPPKKSVNVPSPFPLVPETSCNRELANDVWECKNPFNPFVSEEFPDIPPPTSPPPPPPPRLPTKSSEPSLTVSPPPRPPSRTNGLPTPPLPKRKIPFTVSSRTWFSFDQDATSFPAVSSVPEPATNSTFPAPPLPSPARKLPPAKVEPTVLKSASASNSPATQRRMYNQSPHFGSSAVVRETDENLKLKNITTSPHKILSRHSSIMQDDEIISIAAFNPFESRIVSESPIPEYMGHTNTLTSSPPLPPKPATISRPRPSPSKKMLATRNTSISQSSTSVSTTESSNATRSSSSLVFSSIDENKIGSSSEALFISSIESQTEVFSQNSAEVAQKSSSNEYENKQCDSSPDSIFRRKSDPFADDFFLSLPKKSACKGDSSAVKIAVQQNCSNGIEDHFKDLEAPT